MADDDATQRMMKVVDETLDLVRALGQKVDSIDQKVDNLAKTLDDFRGQTQDDFTIVKARLRRIETTQADHEDRISGLERRK